MNKKVKAFTFTKNTQICIVFPQWVDFKFWMFASVYNLNIL